MCQNTENTEKCLAVGKVLIDGLVKLKNKPPEKERFRFFGRNIADAIKTLRKK